MRNLFATLGTLVCLLAMVFGVLMNVHGGRAAPLVLIAAIASIVAIWKTRAGAKAETFGLWVVFGPMLVVSAGFVGNC